HVCAWLEKKPNDLVPVRDMTMAVKIMLAGKKSKANGGKEERLADLTESDPCFDGYAFEQFYAEQQHPKKENK
ncbi:MAG: hypothetical protein J5843_03255, partial [Clostridia bacterium]|nr:hypothetical protein [Clostridia bacterium]